MTEVLAPPAADAPARWQVLLGDCLAVVRSMPDASVDAIVTDPPYGLGEDPSAENLARWVAEEAVNLTRHDFMGKDWAIPSVAVWRECLRVLKPGGYLLSFGGSRTIDLITFGLRLAGFEIRDSIHWMYGCLTEDAEVLTSDGWRRGVDVETGDLVAAWDSETGHIELAPVEEKTIAPWSGPLVRFRNDDTDQLLTPNHRVYHRPRQRRMENGHRRCWYEERYEVAEAGAIGRWNPLKLPVAGVHDGPGIGGVGYAALLGWVWTEGGYDTTGSGVRIYQSASANPAKVDEIDALVSAVVPSRRRYDRERAYEPPGGGDPRTVSETCWFLSGEPAARVRRDLPDKHPTWSLLWRMTAVEKRAFWDAAMKGDGCGPYAFYQKAERDLEWAQALLATIGMRAKIGMRAAPRDGGQLYVTPRATTELQQRHLRDASEHYEGRVWCVKVRTGAFVARRAGKVFITGNSGFPKSLDVGRAIDESLCTTPGRHYWHEASLPKGEKAQPGDHVCARTAVGEEWDGWGTALKPAHEPVVVGRRPLEWDPVAEKPLTVARNVLEHGTAALNVDACRLQAPDVPEGRLRHGGGAPSDKIQQLDPEKRNEMPAGRWPPNVLLTHAPECRQVGTRKVKSGTTYEPKNGTKDGIYHGDMPHLGRVTGYGGENREETVAAWECAPGCPVAILDAQSGDLTSGVMAAGTTRSARSVCYGQMPDSATLQDTYGDSGGASRFFPTFSWDPDLDVPFLYCAKPARAERDAGLDDVMPTTSGESTEREEGSAGTRSPRAGAGRNGGSKNFHPTVKPIRLMEWLVRLVTPKDGLVLDPFAGSGTTGCAAVRAGFRFLGIEREEPYVQIAVRRIALAAGAPRAKEIGELVRLKPPTESAPDPQLGLFGGAM